ncbi:TPA: hypothetical protein HA273_01945 [Candidatus Bathyarchaeota archaeon]|nr:hypothetical protein [Candidatus Bathyarchaeota archaeon]HIJ08092.1 hypothetical protein [Candidatus Bathyarchaeota archaeon]
MAYLRKEKEVYEIDYSLEKVWKAIPRALSILKWEVQEKDDTNHSVAAKTDAGFMLFSSVLFIDAISSGENVTRVTVAAETPVTTITSMAEFGRARKRIDLFFEAMAEQLAKKRKNSKSNAQR